MSEPRPTTTTSSDGLRALVEDGYPLPISVTFRKLRQLEDEPYSKRIKQLGEVVEVVIKYAAAIACRSYLIDNASSERVNEVLKQFNTPSLGKWIELLRESLRAQKGAPPAKRSQLLELLRQFYFDKLDGGRAHPVVAHCERLLEKLGNTELRLEPSNGQLLELFVMFRNAKLGHGASMSEGEYGELFASLEPLLRQVLLGLAPVAALTLVHVQEVRVKNQIFIHRAEACMGRGFEPIKLSLTESALNDREVYVCSLVPAPSSSGADGVRALELGLSLSPYLIVDYCPECKQQQVFFFNSLKGKRIEYLSYQCGHELTPGGYAVDFDNIREFLAGKVSTEELFRGKAYGKELKPKALGTSHEDREQARVCLERGAELARTGQHGLAREVLKQAIALDADVARAHFLLACCSIKQQEPLVDILSSFETAVALDPNNAETLVTLARVLLAIARVDDAREKLQRAVEVDPAHVAARELLLELNAP
ncbi:MAG: tetratricopeptide repeat protein [Deltaproteobacteria bacterium]|nr:tetratricopeptide repeat protein [Deltaproteobacteria bacterium]